MFRSGAAPKPKQHPSFAHRTQPVMQQVANISNFNSNTLNVPLPPDDVPAIATPKAGKRPTSSKSYAKTDIFFKADNIPEETVPHHKVTSTTISLGGQDTKDRWTTTTQQAQAGQLNPELVKRGRGVKLVGNEKPTFLWGDGPAHNYQRPKPAAPEPEEEEDEGSHEHPLLTAFRNALASRGARGILSLGKKFKIMDVSK